MSINLNDQIPSSILNIQVNNLNYSALIVIFIYFVDTDMVVRIYCIKML